MNALRLCAAIFTGLYNALFKPNVMALLLFLAGVLGVVSFLGSFLLRITKKPESQHHKTDDPPETGETKSETVEESSLLPSPQLRPVRDFSYVQMLKTQEYWVIVFVFAIVAGAGFVIFNNLGGLILSLGASNGDQDKYVFVLSISNCLGRLVTGKRSDPSLKSSGFVSDRLAHRVFRVWHLVASSSVMTASHFYFAFTSDPSWLYPGLSPVSVISPGIIATGFAYGSLMAFTPTFTSEFFGNKHFAGNWAIIRVAPGLGSFLLSTVLAGSLYQK